MSVLIFTETEKKCFQYILPAQGNLKTLALVERILNKANGTSEDITFEKEELELLSASIDCLDKQCAITLPCLPLIRKVLTYTQP